MSNKLVVMALREAYKPGTRIHLVHMDGSLAAPDGTYGTVTNVGDIGTIHVNWDNGSTLGLIAGVDKFVKCQEE